MEIVAESTLWGGYLLQIIMGSLVSLFLVLMLLGIISGCILEKSFKVGDLVGTVITIILSIFTIALVVDTVQTGPEVQYTALVSDYNEVVSQNGDLITIIKKER